MDRAINELSRYLLCELAPLRSTPFPFPLSFPRICQPSPLSCCIRVIGVVRCILRVDCIREINATCEFHLSRSSENIDFPSTRIVLSFFLQYSSFRLVHFFSISSAVGVVTSHYRCIVFSYTFVRLKVRNYNFSFVNCYAKRKKNHREETGKMYLLDIARKTERFFQQRLTDFSSHFPGKYIYIYTMLSVNFADEENKNGEQKRSPSLTWTTIVVE